jgi:hypothetical protein
VCSEVLRSPLPLIKTSVTVPFLFWCALGTHPWYALSYLFLRNKYPKCAPAHLFFVSVCNKVLR